jgi:hypothetical protein
MGTMSINPWDRKSFATSFPVEVHIGQTYNCHTFSLDEKEAKREMKKLLRRELNRHINSLKREFTKKLNSMKIEEMKGP